MLKDEAETAKEEEEAMNLFFFGYFELESKMPNRCCVYDCNGNYNKASKEKVFRLPRDPTERERWIKMIPRDNIPENPNTVIYERHFPSGYEILLFLGERDLITHHLFSTV